MTVQQTHGRHAEPVHTPDDPRYPDIEVVLTDDSVGAWLGTVTSAMRASGYVPTPMLSEFRLDVMSAGSYHQALQRVMCWVTVKIPYLDDDDG